jgi:biopolymer transport protein ExbD
MRRFSQRGSLVTLSEINITPLLDLAFVLLIIFVITTPLLEQSIDLKLPKGGRPDNQKLNRRDIHTVEISPQGFYKLDKRTVSLDELEADLVREHNSNPNLIVYVRADGMGRNKDLFAVFDRCQRNGITKYSLRTEPERR